MPAPFRVTYGSDHTMVWATQSRQNQRRLHTWRGWWRLALEPSSTPVLVRANLTVTGTSPHSLQQHAFQIKYDFSFPDNLHWAETTRPWVTWSHTGPDRVMCVTLTSPRFWPHLSSWAAIEHRDPASVLNETPGYTLYQEISDWIKIKVPKYFIVELPVKVSKILNTLWLNTLLFYIEISCFLNNVEQVIKKTKIKVSEILNILQLNFVLSDIIEQSLVSVWQFGETRLVWRTGENTWKTLTSGERLKGGLRRGAGMVNSNGVCCILLEIPTEANSSCVPHYATLKGLTLEGVDSSNDRDVHSAKWKGFPQTVQSLFRNHTVSLNRSPKHGQTQLSHTTLDLRFLFPTPFPC
jgi:hypothetical protein